MANLDTRSKRASSVGIALSFVLAPPLPDGTIGQGDRQHIAVSYSGILAGVTETDVQETRLVRSGGTRLRVSGGTRLVRRRRP